MGEIYSGPKFKTNYEKRIFVENENSLDLIRWCKTISKLGMAPNGEAGNAGNLSFRTDKGFVITSAGARLDQVGINELVEVLNVDLEQNILTVIGIGEPSSESVMHSCIYEARSDINAIFHGHDDRILNNLKSLNIPETKVEIEYGTTSLAESVLDILGNNWFILLKNHGFVSMGNSMVDAGKRIIEKDILFENVK